jgi:hypothetical protein
MGLPLLIVAAATACGGSGTHTAPASMHLKPGRYTFHLGGRVVVGDEILCVTNAYRPAGGGFVGKPGHGVGSSTGFSLVVSSSGRVRVTCPAHPGTS